MSHTLTNLRKVVLVLAAACSVLASARMALAGSPNANGAVDGYRLVVNPANPASTLARAQAARMFLKKITTWPDGTPVAVVDQERTAPVRVAFTRDVHKKDVDAVAAYWATLVYSAREMPPQVKRSDDDVLGFVRQTPGAIGYVSAGAATNGVKVLELR
jgi:ABC-type phosphate transport system substrate-binding protein